MMTELQKKLQKVRETRDENELMTYATSAEVALALEVARSLHATPRILEILNRHQAITVRHAVALNSQTSLETLKFLAQDKDQLVRDYARLNFAKKMKKVPTV
ncbi:MAG: hypothetical protein KBD63_08175 [Bacteriovoracaceae bacterium]|nr:hypothetical protein [Bacteriovoracaceae bacterium]